MTARLATSGSITLPVPKTRCESCNYPELEALRFVGRRGVWKCRRLQSCRERQALRGRVAEKRDDRRREDRHIIDRFLHPLIRPAWADGLTPVVTHDVIAAELGVSRGRVQQIEAKALNKIERAAKRLGLTADDVLFQGVTP